MRVIRAPFSARTWLSTMHLLAGFPLGMAGGLIVIVSLSLGIGLLPVGLIGLPILGATLALARAFGQAERWRFSLLCGVEMPAPRPEADTGSWWWPTVRSLTHPDDWKQVLYAVLRFPLGIAGAIVGTALWAVPSVLLTLPAYNHLLPGGGAHLGGEVLRGNPGLALAAVVGVALFLATPWLVTALAQADAWWARPLLRGGARPSLAARVGELERSRARLVAAADTERRRIERDLHDGAQQRLVALAMELGRARAKFATDPEAARVLVEQAHTEAKEALVELRSLVRGVHPPVLSDRGLDAAISGLAARCPVPVRVDVSLASCPSPTIEAVAYFVVAEALANVAKHARARSAHVAVSGDPRVLRVTVSDDGIGGADASGRGLSGLADRVAAVDGRLRITSPSGGPTAIEVELPCES